MEIVARVAVVGFIALFALGMLIGAVTANRWRADRPVSTCLMCRKPVRLPGLCPACQEFCDPGGTRIQSRPPAP
jgi:hypothetical protein